MMSPSPKDVAVQGLPKPPTKFPSALLRTILAGALALMATGPAPAGPDDDDDDGGCGYAASLVNVGARKTI
ncbi:hypothetical protein Mesau_05707 [Mesorhizobium australicum WSM2073]|uniref:Uncharacterized protein n=3 Tax=Mesorhizobium TaxID=68287 RepID=L0KRE2_MESAW|nr:hypothetical protein Mesci_5655 [Mesorhizobium ciceri biovar biserrulae WSM1271]AEH90625.1 hypothetical protein Mesop_6237 [Mesorhizobium opportunistum WSM2075]AGB47997.1 hypothetical protein Mesau_05707 [Mesorhizobium australicum WSM2073]OBP89910.1 hypothetical protein BAE40_13430 [Mesorhizobium loti]